MGGLSGTGRSRALGQPQAMALSTGYAVSGFLLSVSQASKPIANAIYEQQPFIRNSNPDKTLYLIRHDPFLNPQIMALE